MSTRVLVIEDNKDYEGLLTSVLAQRDGAFDLQSAGTLSEGLQAIERIRPEVILVDLDLPDSSGYPTFQRVREVAHDGCLIVLTGLDDEDTAIQAMEDGAQDYLVKSLTQPRTVPQRIQMALQRRRRRAPLPISPKALVLGFLGSKGGVGTSTLAENLAAILAMEGQETAIVDFQPSPERHAASGAAAPAHDLNHLLSKPAGVITAAELKECTTELMHGLRLLRMKTAEGVWRPLGAAYVTAIVSLVRQFCTHVVLDLGSRVDESVAAALRACDIVTVVLDTDPAAIDSCATLLRQLEMVMSPKMPEIRLVAVDRLHHNQGTVANQMVRHLKMRPVLTVTPAADDLATAYLAGMPLLTTLHPDDAFRRSIQALADALLSSASGRDGVP